MRNLVILRGCPGSGKSTWVKEMGLENYTLCADTLRMLTESPIIVETEQREAISQKNDKYVWQLLFELLEKRMSRGEFVVVDATHSRSSDFSRYNNLCEKYRYRRYYVDFTNVPIEICKERNLKRENYKRVPENVIDKMYSRFKTQGKTSGWVEVSKDNFWNEIGIKLFDMNKYNKIHIFGDIHGCLNPLAHYFENEPYSENDMYIFCGDYTDRGIQNKETLESLMKLSEKRNTLFLEGNHERWVNYYANDEIEKVKSKTFLKKTLGEIIDIDKKELRSFYRKIGQMAYFTFDDKKYFVTHGGLSYMPKNLNLVATDQMIHGVGDYNVNIDEIWSNNYTDTIQVHCHRNTFEIDNIGEMSYNLEGKVEFGGYLKVLQLENGYSPRMIYVKNDHFAPEKEVNEFNECRTKLSMSTLEQLRVSNDIRETVLDNNISSFNFTRNVFYSKRWNNLTCKARGLFIDTEKDKVVARGYEKFFNVNENNSTKLEHLLTKFKDKKITCYKKENGFLGIMSYVNGELFIASKSTNQGTYADYFRKIYENSDIEKEKLIEYLKNNNVSLTFEVIDIENDPHIIEYDKSQIILLDIIHNDYEFKREPYKNVVKLAEEINCKCKSIYIEFDNVRDFHRWYLENTDEDDLSKNDIEGVVIECGDIMTKLKFPYYNFWKSMRRVKEQVLHRHTIKLSSLYNATSNYFYGWLKEQDEETLTDDIITLRKMFYESGYEE